MNLEEFKDFMNKNNYLSLLLTLFIPGILYTGFIKWKAILILMSNGSKCLKQIIR